MLYTRGIVPGQGGEGRGDAVEAGERGRWADAVCGTGGEWEGETGGAVPGVWDLATDGLPLAGAVPAGGKLHGAAGAEPASAAESHADRQLEGRTDSEPAGRDGVGREEVACAAARRAGVEVPARTIHRILQRRGRVSEEAHARALGRFERSQPNELWQMDTKGRYPQPERECHPLSLLDDHSRYLVGLYALPGLSIALAWPCLVETFRQHGVPQGMLMDRGPLWWSEQNGWSLTWLSVQLIEQGIELHYGRVRHP
jgi:hypothetical protein